METKQGRIFNKLYSIFKRSEEEKEQGIEEELERLSSAANGLRAASKRWTGLSKPEAHSWTGDWADWENPVKQTMVQLPDSLLMRLAPFKSAFVIDSRKQDYNGNGFVGWLADIIEYKGRVFYVTFWNWPKGEVFPIHFHDWAEIHLCIFGLLEYFLDGKQVLVKTGRSILFESNMMHGAVSLEDSLLCMIIEKEEKYSSTPAR